MDKHGCVLVKHAIKQLSLVCLNVISNKFLFFCLFARLTYKTFHCFLYILLTLRCLLPSLISHQLFWLIWPWKQENCCMPPLTVHSRLEWSSWDRGQLCLVGTAEGVALTAFQSSTLPVSLLLTFQEANPPSTRTSCRWWRWHARITSCRLPWRGVWPSATPLQQ